MNYKYIETRANSDDTLNYDIVGDFPVTFADFFRWVLTNENSFRVIFGATNKCYGGWLGSRLVIYKDRVEDSWYWEHQEPKYWFEEIEQKKVIKCWANGGWGQMSYFCTFEE